MNRHELRLRELAHMLQPVCFPVNPFTFFGFKRSHEALYRAKKIALSKTLPIAEEAAKIEAKTVNYALSKFGTSLQDRVAFLECMGLIPPSECDTSTP